MAPGFLCITCIRDLASEQVSHRFGFVEEL